MKSLTKLAFLLLLACWTLPVAAAQETPLETRWEFYALDAAAREETGLDSGLLAVFTLTPAPGWYTYSDRPGELGLPTRLTAELEGAGPLAVLMPPGTPKKDEADPSVTVDAYVGPTRLFVPLTPGAQAPLRIKARLDLLLCTKDKCLPTRLEVPVEGAEPTLSARAQPWWPTLKAALDRFRAHTEAPPEAQAEPIAPPGATREWNFRPTYFQPAGEVSELLPAVLLGLLAGFLLNFMPCVLPVISLKLSSLLNGSAAGTERERHALFREHNLFFALGALLYFLFLSALLGLTGLAWGQIFQQTAVVLGLTALIFALTLSLLGLFNLPVLNIMFRASGRPRLNALATGVLTTLLATPGSGPFLGGVLGWALLQPPIVISAVFLAIGLGMSSPYLLFALRPGLVRYLPKPGPWIAYVEKGVAFFLLGTCIYLLNILPQDRLIPAMVLLWLTVLVAWMLGRAELTESRSNAIMLRFAALIFFGLVFSWAIRPRVETSWTDFEPGAFTQALGTENLLVDFTADWCPTCKVLEQTVLTPGNLAVWKEKHGLTLVRVDLTRSDPAAESLLRALGSKSIPVLAVFTKEAPDRPLVLRDFFTAGQVRKALERSLTP